MRIAFTICTNNYLPQAFSLKESFLKTHPSDQFIIILVDKLIKLDGIIPVDLNNDIIEITGIEPTVESLASKYSIIELSTAVKPAVFLWLLKNKISASAFIYLDPDLYFYGSLGFMDKFPSTSRAFLTPHILEPITDGSSEPTENLFLKYGIYNLGFIYLKNDPAIEEFLLWWKDHTYSRGFNNPTAGQFVDQLPLNLAPVFFDYFHVLKHYGMNVAPWNFQERIFSEQQEGLTVNGDPLVFIHFSNFSPEYPDKISYRNWYPRNELQKGSILADLYNKYSKVVTRMGYSTFTKLKSVYHKAEQKKSLRSRVKRYVDWFF
jgi:hypothetical protein